MHLSHHYIDLILLNTFFREDRGRSPKPPIYKPEDAKRSPAEGVEEVDQEVTGSLDGSLHGSRPPPEGVDGGCAERASPEGSGVTQEVVTGRTSREELQNISEVCFAYGL